MKRTNRRDCRKADRAKLSGWGWRPYYCLHPHRCRWHWCLGRLCRLWFPHVYCRKAKLHGPKSRHSNGWLCREANNTQGYPFEEVTACEFLSNTIFLVEVHHIIRLVHLCLERITKEISASLILAQGWLFNLWTKMNQTSEPLRPARLPEISQHPKFLGSLLTSEADGQEASRSYQSASLQSSIVFHHLQYSTLFEWCEIASKCLLFHCNCRIVLPYFTDLNNLATLWHKQWQQEMVGRSRLSSGSSAE